MNIEAILIGIIIVTALLILIIIVVGAIKANKKGKTEEIKENEVVASVVSEVKEEKVTSMKVVIAQGESIVVGSEGRIPCGEYTMESCTGEETFNVRIGRYVKEYSNGCKVVLTEKQKVTPVSTSIILR